MGLASVTGQERARAQIGAWLGSGRLPHAILITGREGVGKRRMALELAKAITCRRFAGDACDVCPSCLRAERLTHPDIHVLLPLPTGSGRSGAESEPAAALREAALEYLQGGGLSRSGTNIPKEHVRLLQREMAYAPTEAPRRVAILLEADCMHPAGANSLLKILEEPPRHAVFLLVAGAADRVLPTIASRCQRLHLRSLSEADVRRRIQTAGGSAERALLAARLAAGSNIRPADVAAEEFDGHRQLAERFLDAGLAGREDDFWALLEEVGARPDRRRLETFLGLCSSYVRDLFLIGLDRGDRVAHIDRREQLATWSELVAADRLDRFAQALDQAYESLTRNVSPQLVLADLWSQLRRCGGGT